MERFTEGELPSWSSGQKAFARLLPYVDNIVYQAIGDVTWCPRSINKETFPPPEFPLEFSKLVHCGHALRLYCHHGGYYELRLKTGLLRLNSEFFDAFVLKPLALALYQEIVC